MRNTTLFAFLLLPFFTLAQSSPNCANAPYILCGGAYPVSSNGPGSWLISCNGEQGVTFGQETIYKFIAPSSGVFSLQIQVIAGGGTLAPGITYFYREDIPGLECGADNWKCIGTANVSGAISFGPLTGGKTYLIVGDANSTGPTMQSISIGDCSVSNDAPELATPVMINADCTVQTNIFSTVEPGEPDPDIDPTDGYTGRWLSPATHTLWFKFIAPTNGTVTISATPYPTGKVLDTRLALYEVGDSSNYASYKLLESDDNETFAAVADTLNAAIPYTGLTPGKLYYVQLDASYLGIDAQSPFFCLKIANCIRRTNITSCATAYYQPKVNGLTENKWYGIYTQPKPGDLGQLAAAVKPGLQDLDTVYCNLRVTTTPQQSYNGIYYMPAYVRIYAKKAITVPPVGIRMFFTNNEFDSLKLKTLMPNKNIGDLNVSWFSGFQNEDCTPLNNANSGTINLITSIDTIRMACTQSFFLDFNSTGFGEFGAHFGLQALPLDLLTVTGEGLRDINRISWTTENEQNVHHFRIERSANGYDGWFTIGSKPAKGTGSVTAAYSVDDNAPMREAYYRVVAVDNDGKEQISISIVVRRNDERFGFVQVYPNPVQDVLYVQWRTPSETVATIQITDMTGRLIYQQPQPVVSGQNTITLHTSHLSAGTYVLSVADGNAVLQPVRFVVR